jgi:hypothetical protein
VVTQWSLEANVKTTNPNKYKGLQAFLTITPGNSGNTNESRSDEKSDLFFLFSPFFIFSRFLSFANFSLIRSLNGHSENGSKRESTHQQKAHEGGRLRPAPGLQDCRETHPGIFKALPGAGQKRIRQDKK